MRNTTLLARLYDALHKGDDEDEKDWQAVGASPMERGTWARFRELKARAAGPTLNEGGYVGPFDIRINLDPRGFHTVYPSRAGRRS